MYPMILAPNMPPIAPAIPPMPTTELTACRGVVSETKVERLAEKPWWAEAARPTSRVAVHRPDTREAMKTGTTHSAQISIVILRAALTVQPRLRSQDESQPPPTLPTSVIK